MLSLIIRKPWLVLAIILFAGCTGNDPAALQTITPTPTAVTFSTSEPSVVAPTVVQPTHTPQSETEFTSYDFDVTLDTERVQEEVIETINFTSPDKNILLVVPPNRAPGVFTLEELRWGDGTLVEGVILEGENLSFPLRGFANPGEKQELVLRYRLDLPAGKGPLNNTGRQLNFGDWYPFLPVYDEDAGWLAHPPGAVGEHLVYDLADYEVTLRLAQPDPKWVVAASAPAEPLENGWHFSLPAARSFSFSVSDQYEVTESFVNGTRVLSYAFPEHRAQSQVALATTSDALALFSELYGKYPHATLSLVEAEFSDGMEYDGLYYLGESYYRQHKGEPLSYLVAIAAHETAHQWFYGMVGNNPAMEPWLDEALATYSELLFYECYYPEIAADWWTFRVNAYHPSGWVDGTIYDHGSFRPYVNAVYLRGAEFLRDLRVRMGDDAFIEFLKDYAVQGSEKSPGSLATTKLFFDVLAGHTDQDISDLTREYFKNPTP